MGTGPAVGAVAQAAHEERARGGTQAAGPDTRIRLVLWRHGQTGLERGGPVPGPDRHPAGRDRRAAGRAGRPAAGGAAPGRHHLLGPEPGDGHCRAAGPADRADREHRQGSAGTARRRLGRPDRRADPHPYPVEHAQWMPPGGESTATVGERAGAALDRIADGLAPGSLAVVVSHGAALRLGAARAAWPARGPVGRHRAALQLRLVGPGPAQSPVAAASSTTPARCRSRCSATTADGGC